MIWENNDDIRLEHCDHSRREIQHVLDTCREERRPYVITTPLTSNLNISSSDDVGRGGV